MPERFEVLRENQLLLEFVIALGEAALNSLENQAGVDQG